MSHFFRYFFVAYFIVSLGIFALTRSYYPDLTLITHVLISCLFFFLVSSLHAIIVYKKLLNVAYVVTQETRTANHNSPLPQQKFKHFPQVDRQKLKQRILNPESVVHDTTTPQSSNMTDPPMTPRSDHQLRHVDNMKYIQELDAISQALTPPQHNIVATQPNFDPEKEKLDLEVLNQTLKNMREAKLQQKESMKNNHETSIFSIREGLSEALKHPEKVTFNTMPIVAFPENESWGFELICSINGFSLEESFFQKSEDFTHEVFKTFLEIVKIFYGKQNALIPKVFFPVSDLILLNQTNQKEIKLFFDQSVNYIGQVIFLISHRDFLFFRASHPTILPKLLKDGASFCVDCNRIPDFQHGDFYQTRIRYIRLLAHDILNPANRIRLKKIKDISESLDISLIAKDIQHPSDAFSFFDTGFLYGSGVSLSTKNKKSERL